ncbi:hypothetical protein ROZALSC1DRAFT_29301 [Rozella allomycis CSF55]|uniref:Uncharacterized protein n=1 Tax=Rozella allomycis (strain CSF55) TaxID=988480 RepID=A0A4P9YJP7_ROZAC|nr:hypothetical protein ROZALSC1DRAFT_29301 [Rozella allomycis CSF55]
METHSKFYDPLKYTTHSEESVIEIEEDPLFQYIQQLKLLNMKNMEKNQRKYSKYIYGLADSDQASKSQQPQVKREKDVVQEIYDFKPRIETKKPQKQINSEPDDLNLHSRKSLLHRALFHPLTEIQEKVTNEPKKPREFRAYIPKKPEKEYISAKKFQSYMLEVQQREELELKRKFKANPIPSSSITPKMITKQQAMSAKSMKERQDKLLGDTKPFNLSQYKHKKSHFKIENSSNCQEFKANPVPKFSMEDEQKALEKRKKKIKERAVNLLKQSSLPPRMAMAKTCQGQSKESLAQSYYTFKPEIKKIVPPFKRLQSSFERRLHERRAKRRLNKKFHKSITKEQALKKVQKDIELDERRMPESRWPFLSSRCKTKSLSLPKFDENQSEVKTTNAFDLFIQKQIQKEENKQLEKRKKEKEQFLYTRKFPQVKIALKKLLGPILEKEKVEENKRKKELKLKDKENTLKYTLDLKIINDRLNSKPLLLETFSWK